MELIILTLIFTIGIIIFICVLGWKMSKSIQSSNPQPPDWASLFFMLFLLDQAFPPPDTSDTCEAEPLYFANSDDNFDDNYDRDHYWDEPDDDNPYEY